MKPDLKTLKEWVAQCNNKPLEAGDPRFVSLDEITGGNWNAVAKTIFLSDRPTSQIICGQPGTGRSTRLLGLQKISEFKDTISLPELHLTPQDFSSQEIELPITNVIKKAMFSPDGKPNVLYQILKGIPTNQVYLIDLRLSIEILEHFFRYHSKNFELPCHVIYTIPSAITMVFPEITKASDRFATLHPPDVEQNPKHLETIRSLVGKRFPLDWVFGKTTHLDQLIYASGGILSTLFSMIREAIVHHPNEEFPLNQVSVDYAIQSFKQRATAGLQQDSAKLLARMHETGNLDGFKRSEIMTLAESSAHFIIHPGEKDRYRLHPLSKGRILELAAEQNSKTHFSGATGFEPDHSLKNLKITAVRLQNIRCFQDVEITLKSQEIASWAMVLGNNAVGKTSFLRAVVLGLCEESTATALIKKIPGSFIRRGQTNASIVIELQNGTETPFTITTQIQKAPDGENEIVRKETTPETFPWEDIFVCAYGVERTKQADQGFERYRMDQAVMTLFNYNGSLQNPELILLRQGTENRRCIEQKLLEVLMLDTEENVISQSGSGIEVTGPWGSMPFDALSDGYRGTMQWLVDFIAWSLYAKRFGPEGPTGGIVLIDELEQHLHPRWQRQIISRLKKQFPHVQFIITTHSPLIAGSMGSVMPDQGNGDKMLHLDMDESGNIELDELESVKGLDLDQVLASPAFDYLVQADPQVEEVLAQASRLAGKGAARTEEEEARYLAIKTVVKKIIGRKGHTLIEQEAHEELYREMMDEIKDLEDAVFGKDQ